MYLPFLAVALPFWWISNAPNKSVARTWDMWRVLDDSILRATSVTAVKTILWLCKISWTSDNEKGSSVVWLFAGKIVGFDATRWTARRTRRPRLPTPWIRMDPLAGRTFSVSCFLWCVYSFVCSLVIMKLV